MSLKPTKIYKMVEPITLIFFTIYKPIKPVYAVNYEI